MGASQWGRWLGGEAGTDWDGWLLVGIPIASTPTYKFFVHNMLTNLVDELLLLDSLEWLSGLKACCHKQHLPTTSHCDSDLGYSNCCGKPSQVLRGLQV